LTFVADLQVWQPLSREEFRQLRRDDRIRDRGGRIWTLRADAYLDRVEGERFHDSYMLVDGG
jgi:hypothetical protein